MARRWPYGHICLTTIAMGPPQRDGERPWTDASAGILSPPLAPHGQTGVCRGRKRAREDSSTVTGAVRRDGQHSRDKASARVPSTATGLAQTDGGPWRTEASARGLFHRDWCRTERRAAFADQSERSGSFHRHWSRTERRRSVAEGSERERVLPP